MLNIIFDRKSAAQESSGKKDSAFYQDIADGLFVPGVKIGRRAVAWARHEHQAIAAARLAGKTDDEIRALVKKLVAARTQDQGGDE